MNDMSIIDLFWNREERAISELKLKYEKLCYKISGNILSQKEDVEECVNDTYLAVWNSIPPDRPTFLSAYVCKFVKNNSLNILKYNQADKRNASFTLSLEELSDCLSTSQNTEELASVKDLGEAISRFLWTQNEKHRKVFIRRYWYSDSLDEISELYGINEKTVATILHRMRAKLKKYLEREGYEL